MHTIVKAQYIPDNIPYTAMCFRNWEGDCLAFFNKPEFVFPCDEDKAKNLPIYQALPGTAGELTMVGIRKALEGERFESIIEVKHRGLVHEMHRNFVPYTDEICAIMLRNPLNERTPVKYSPEIIQQLSNRYKNQTWLAPIDPDIVFWIDRHFVYQDQRYQPNIMLRNPDSQFGGPTKVEDEVLPKDARMIEGAVTRTLETREPQHIQLTIQKQCCWVTEDILYYALKKNLVMSTVTYIRSICLNHQHPSLHERMMYVPEDLSTVPGMVDRADSSSDQGQ